jgi:hypothetical protein
MVKKRNRLANHHGHISEESDACSRCHLPQAGPSREIPKGIVVLGDDSPGYAVAPKAISMIQNVEMEVSHINDPDLSRVKLMCIFVSYVLTKKFRKLQKNQHFSNRKVYRIGCKENNFV